MAAASAGTGLRLSRSALELQLDVLAPNQDYALPPAGLARTLDLAVASTQGRGQELRDALTNALGMPVDLHLRTPTRTLDLAVPLLDEDATVPGHPPTGAGGDGTDAGGGAHLALPFRANRADSVPTL